MPNCETKTRRSRTFVMEVLISVALTLQILRIGLRKIQSGKSMGLEKHKAAFSLSAEKWCLPLPSKFKPVEREFVVDSGASMHMKSRKDLKSAEFETVTTSRCPTTVITANGEVQTHEKATVYGRELDIFLTVKIIEDTPAVLSLGKLCEHHGYS